MGRVGGRVRSGKGRREGVRGGKSRIGVPSECVPSFSTGPAGPPGGNCTCDNLGRIAARSVDTSSGLSGLQG